MKTILVTGANGQLGNELNDIRHRFPEYDMIFTDLPELDITDSITTENFLKIHPVDYIINCAAYTAVDKAESEPEKAMLINATAPGMLAALAKKYDKLLVHVSTDYIFDGQSKLPYTESDTPDPQSVYGKSKLAGEQAIIETGSNALIFRTSWLYSSYGHNFVKTILRIASERDEIKVVDDQVGTPTWAADLAQGILAMLDKHQSKGTHVYHYSNEGYCSWHEFAKTIIEFSGLSCRVVPIKTSDYPQAATRPVYSLLDKSKIIEDYGIAIPNWKDSLKNCLEKIKNNPL